MYSVNVYDWGKDVGLQFMIVTPVKHNGSGAGNDAGSVEEYVHAAHILLSYFKLATGVPCSLEACQESAKKTKVFNEIGNCIFDQKVPGATCRSVCSFVRQETE